LSNCIHNSICRKSRQNIWVTCTIFKEFSKIIISFLKKAARARAGERTLDLVILFIFSFHHSSSQELSKINSIGEGSPHLVTLVVIVPTSVTGDPGSDMTTERVCMYMGCREIMAMFSCV
jgi:hypothetical protein